MVGACVDGNSWRRDSRVVAPNGLPRHLVAERTARTWFVAIDPPNLADHSGLQETVEEFAVEALVAQIVVQAFDVAVLPRLLGVV